MRRGFSIVAVGRGAGARPTAARASRRRLAPYRRQRVGVVAARRRALGAAMLDALEAAGSAAPPARVSRRPVTGRRSGSLLPGRLGALVSARTPGTKVNIGGWATTTGREDRGGQEGRRRARRRLRSAPPPLPASRDKPAGVEDHRHARTPRPRRTRSSAREVASSPRRRRARSYSSKPGAPSERTRGPPGVFEGTARTAGYKIPQQRAAPPPRVPQQSPPEQEPA